MEKFGQILVPNASCRYFNLASVWLYAVYRNHEFIKSCPPFVSAGSLSVRSTLLCQKVKWSGQSNLVERHVLNSSTSKRCYEVHILSYFMWMSPINLYRAFFNLFSFQQFLTYNIQHKYVQTVFMDHELSQDIEILHCISWFRCSAATASR